MPIVLNTTARSECKPEALRRELTTQISMPVLWDASIRTLSNLGCDTFLELGPGQVLTGLGKRILPNGTHLSAATPDAIERAAAVLSVAEPEYHLTGIDG
jgi:[acyl-carrier-protein] S-malonyltransferase